MAPFASCLLVPEVCLQWGSDLAKVGHVVGEKTSYRHVDGVRLEDSGSWKQRMVLAVQSS